MGKSCIEYFVQSYDSLTLNYGNIFTINGIIYGL